MCVEDGLSLPFLTSSSFFLNTFSSSSLLPINVIGNNFAKPTTSNNYVQNLVLVVWLLTFLTVLEADFTDINARNHMVNGNKSKNLYMDFMCQNIPGTKRIPEVQVAIDTILDRYSPTVLGEVDSDKVAACSFDNYIHVGNLKKGRRVRISMLVKVSYSFTNINLDCYVPTVSIRLLDKFTVIGVYYEWSLMTMANLSTEKCLKSLFDVLSTLQPKNITILGDVNIDLNDRNKGNH